MLPVQGISKAQLDKYEQNQAVLLPMQILQVLEHETTPVEIIIGNGLPIASAIRLKTAEWSLSALTTESNLASIVALQAQVAALQGAEKFVESLAELKALDPTEYQRVTLVAANRNRNWVWIPGDFSAVHAIDTLEGYFAKADGVASTVGSWVAELDSTYDINVGKFGRAPSLTNSAEDFTAAADMQPAIQTALNLAVFLFGERNLDSAGSVVGGTGYYKMGSGISIPRSLKFRIDGQLWYTPAAGRCLYDSDTKLTANQHEGYNIEIGGLYAVNGNNDIPTAHNPTGSVGVELKNTQNSYVRIGAVTRFTQTNLDINSSNDQFIGQNNQGTRIWVGYCSYGGYGIRQRSHGAATGAAQACHMHVANLISNFCHIEAGASGDTDSSDCTWQIDAMEAPVPGGKSLVVNGDRHDFTIGFAHVGSIIEVNATSNDVQFDIRCADLFDLVVTDSGTSTSWLVNGQYVTFNANQAALTLVSTDDSASASGSLNVQRLAVIGDNAFMNGTNYQGWNSAEGLINYVNDFTYIITDDPGNENGQRKMYTVVGGTSGLRMEIWQGLVMAGASGGDKGTGTGNFTGVYDDNLLLACYVFDAYFDPDRKVNKAKWDAKVPNRILPEETRDVLNEKGDVIASYPVLAKRTQVRKHKPLRKFLSRIGTEYDPFDRDKFWQHIVDKKHLYAFPNEDKYDPEKTRKSQGEWQTDTVEILEVYAVHIHEMNEEIKELRTLVKQLTEKDS